MKSRILLFILICLLTSGCSSVVILPATESGSFINSEGNRVSKTVDGVQFAVNVHEATVRPSPAEKNYCSFWVEITNHRNVLLPLKLKDFALIDNTGRQYQPVDPDVLVDLLAMDIPYLIPYPYVGFYYLQDSLRYRGANNLRSESAYFLSRKPAYLKQDALPQIDVLPASQVAGTIYFAAELRHMENFQIIYLTGSLPGQIPLPIALPFTVEKK